MLKGIGNLASIFKQAQQLQGRMSEIQENLGQLRVEGQAGGGMVTVEASGHQKILNIRVEEALLESNDREMLEDLLVAAVNQALDKAKDAATEEMSKMTGEMNLPGLDDALSKFGLNGGPDAPLEA
jgi:DNA-binding YbaB/EbfC family protein